MKIDKDKIRLIKRLVIESLLLSIIYWGVSYLLVNYNLIDPDALVGVILGMPGLLLGLADTFAFISYTWILIYYFIPTWIAFFLLLGIINIITKRKKETE